MGFLTGEGSLFNRIFGFLGQMILLNFLWMVCSLPVITAGASTTALFYCTLKLHKDKDISVIRDFFKSFRQNFMQSTIAWALLLLAGGVLWMEKEALSSMPGSMGQIFSWGLVAVAIPLALITLYIFPTIAAFENKLGKLISNAFYFAVKKVGYALVVMIVTTLPMTMTLVDAKLFPVYLFIWLTVGFSLTAYGDSWFMWRLFKPYFPEEEREEKKYNAETDSYVF